MPRATFSPSAAVRELQDATSGRHGVALALGWRALHGAVSGRPVLLIQNFSGGKWTTVHVLGGADPGAPPEGAALPVYAAAPPAASSVWRGRSVIVRLVSGVDQVMTCLQNSAGGFEWLTVGQSS